MRGGAGDTVFGRKRQWIVFLSPDAPLGRVSARVLLSTALCAATIVVMVAPTSNAVGAVGATATCTTGWVNQSPTNSAGHQYFTDVAALPGGQSFAVGYQSTGPGTTQPLTEEWNGGNWAVQSVQSVSPYDTELNAVSMSSTTDGWAVGWASGKGGTRYRTLAEHWNGSGWVASSTANLGRSDNLLFGVDDLGSRGTWAVGYGQATVAGTRQALTEFWNGSTWSLAPTPNVGSVDNVLLAVGGSSSADLWAVGYTNTAAGFQTLIEHFNGRSWAVTASPEGGLFDNVLTSVSVDGADDAWAVGYDTTAGGAYRPLVEHWDGTSWSVNPTPAVDQPVEVLRSVVAVSPANVWVVGDLLMSSNNFQGVSLHWNGLSWSSTAVSSEDGQLRAVSETSGNGPLWAVGDTSRSATAFTTCSGAAGPAGAAGPPLVAGKTALRMPVPQPPATEGSITSAPVLPSSQTATGSTATAEQVVAVDQSTAAGLPQTSNDVAAAVADFGNGYQDIFYAGETQRGGLYLNNGTGKLTEIDSLDFPPADRRSCSTADVLGNGYTDIFCTVGAQWGNGIKTDDLYMESSSMAFTNEAGTDGVVDPFARGGATTFVQTPGGLPDLFVGADPIRSDGLPSPNRFFINTGHGFEDSPQYGLDQSIGAICASAGDYSGNGLTDLLVCADNGLRLYENTGSKFVDVTQAAGIPSIVARDAIFTDLNGDGLPDIVIVTEHELLVFLQNSDHTFTQSFSMSLTAGVSVAAGDVNGDGVPDLYVVQGAFQEVHNEPDLMLLNNGSGTGFTQMSIPETSLGQGNLALPVDYVGNGLTDFLVLNGGLISRPGPSQLVCFYPAIPPVITSPATAAFTEGSVSTFTVTAVGSPTPFLSESGSLPPGVNFTDNGNGTATIAGLPTSSGAFPITITAQNGVAPAASQDVTLTVNPSP